MPDQFQVHRAPRVTAGDPITSTQLKQLAAAFNDRFRLNIGNPVWRTAVYSLALMRQVRNPDSSGFLYPSEFEHHDFYSHVQEGQGHWAATGPGEPEGPNLANPLMAYIFGAEALNLYDESTRMTDPFYGGLDIEVPGGTEPEAWRKWVLRKRQAGGWDPITGAVACPAFDVARAYAVIRQSRFSPHGYAYGGFLAGPAVISSPACAEVTSGGPVPINLEITFTAVREGVTYSGSAASYVPGGTDCGGDDVVGVLTYPGTCWQTDDCWAATDPRLLDPLNPDYDPSHDQSECYPGHVVGVIYSPWSYYVIVNGSSSGVYSVDELPTTDWLEGPYCGGTILSRTFGSVLERVFWEFIRGFRGSEPDQAQPTVGGGPPAGDPPTEWLSHAFDIQRFFTEQYSLAPAAGTTAGGEIVVTYPMFHVEHSGIWPAGGLLPNAAGGHSHTVKDGCVVHGACLYAKGVGAETAVELRDMDRRLVARLKAGVGDSAQTVWFSKPSELVAAGSSVIATIAGQGLTIADGGFLRIELAESMEYRPQLWDLFMVIRLMGAKATA
jgi:hypothetical protein